MCQIICYVKYILTSICDEIYYKTGTFFYIHTQYTTVTIPLYVRVSKMVLLVTMINVVTKLDRQFGN